MKNPFKKKVLPIALAGVLVFGSILYAGADEYDDAIADMEAETAYTQQMIDDHYASLDNLQYEKEVLLSQIDETDAELVITLASISTLSDQVSIKTQDLSQTTKELEEAENDEAVQYAAMKKRIQYLYETGGESGWATALLEDEDINDYLNRAEYTRQMYTYDRNCLEEYAATVERVKNLKARQEQEKSDLELMLANQQEQQAYFEERLAQMQAESGNYDEQIAYVSQTAAAYVDLLNEQNSVIQQLLYEQELVRQAEEAARIAAEEEAARIAAEEEAARQAAEEEARRRQEEEQQQSGGEEEQPGPPPAPDPGYDVTTGNAIVDRAYAWVGRAEYVWGGCSPGAFDCSGFVSYCVTGVYARIGTTYTFLGFPRVSDPQPGDICTSDTHCGIYIGGGQMIHASDYGVGVIIGPVPGNMIYVRY